MTDKQEYILCAAIKRIEPKKCNPYYDEMNDICDIEIGYRHHDILQRFYGEVSKNPKDQGFYTSAGRFVDRREGMLIAIDAGQIEKVSSVFRPNKNGELVVKDLYSEDLY